MPLLCWSGSAQGRARHKPALSHVRTAAAGKPGKFHWIHFSPEKVKRSRMDVPRWEEVLAHASKATSTAVRAAGGPGWWESPSPRSV